MPVVGTIPAAHRRKHFPGGCDSHFYGGSRSLRSRLRGASRGHPESPSEIRIQVPVGTLKDRQNIRRRGENSLVGSVDYSDQRC